MGTYGIEDTDAVYSAGSNIHGQADSIYAACQDALRKLWGISGMVSGPVGGALDAFCCNNAWRPGSLAAVVEECGSAIADTSNIVVDGENEMTGVQWSAAPAERAPWGRPILERDINL